MKLRPLHQDDESLLRDLNAEYYPNDAYPDFKRHLSPVLAVVDDEDKIITAGGVELIAEGVSITDKSRSPHTRGKALRMLMQSMLLTCGRVNQNFLQISVTDEDWTWMRALEGDGFKPTGGRQFYIEVK